MTKRECSYRSRIGVLLLSVAISACGGSGSNTDDTATSGEGAGQPSTGTGGSGGVAQVPDPEACGGIGKGSPSMPSSALQLRVDGLQPGVTHDQLRVTGRARLGGNLVVLFGGEYKPKAGDAIRLIEAQCIEGSFVRVTATGGVSLKTIQDSISVTVVVQ